MQQRRMPVTQREFVDFKLPLILLILKIMKILLRLANNKNANNKNPSRNCEDGTLYPYRAL